jgi:hypothetical protein
MIKLWIKENDIPQLTSFAGSIDSDSLKPFVYIAQTTDLKPILGLELYNKINTDYIANSLSGVYLQIYDDYILDMLVYFSCSRYIALNPVKVAQNGIIKPEMSADKKEIDSLSARYNTLANNVVVNFKAFIETQNIPEYNQYTEKRTTNIIPWY